MRRHNELLARQLLFDICTGFTVDCRVDGDYLEFGCAWGGSLVDMFASTQRHAELASRRFFIFDSFQGLPAPSGQDAGELVRYREGEFACSLDRYKANVQRQGVDLGRVTCVEGWYDQTLTAETKRKLAIEKAAIVLIDCDLYESTVPVLRFLSDYIQDGTILIFDDWFSYKGRLDHGEARAFGEWLAENPSITATEYHKTGRTMASFIMRVDKKQ